MFLQVIFSLLNKPMLEWRLCIPCCSTSQSSWLDSVYLGVVTSTVPLASKFLSSWFPPAAIVKSPKSPLKPNSSLLCAQAREIYRHTKFIWRCFRQINLKFNVTWCQKWFHSMAFLHSLPAPHSLEINDSKFSTLHGEAKLHLARRSKKRCETPGSLQ